MFPIFKEQVLSLRMGQIGRSEMSITKHQSALRNILQERRSRCHRGGSLKPQQNLHIILYIVLKSHVR